MAFVVALFDYGEGATFGTPFSEGDVFRLLEKTNDEWWKVERQDRKIIYVPKQFVEVRDVAALPGLPPLPPPPQSFPSIPASVSEPTSQPGAASSPRSAALRRAHTTSAVPASPRLSCSSGNSQPGLFVNMKKVALPGGKKSSTRNWTPLFCILLEHNIMFYKDRKMYEKTRTQGSMKRKVSAAASSESSTFSLEGTSCNLVKDHKRKNVLELCNEKSGTIWVQTETASAFDEFRKLLVSAGVNTGASCLTHHASAIDEDDDDEEDKKVVKKKLQAFFRRRPPLESIQSLVKDQYFGVHLDRLCEREGVQIPNFVESTVQAIEQRGLDHVGIYRLSGNASQVQKIRFKVDQEECVDPADLSACDDINVLTGALKLFLRELPEPVIPFACLDDFVAAIQLPSEPAKVAAVNQQVQRLPACNYATLKYLLAHLARVAKLGDTNKMLIPNISIVFGPTLMRKEIETANMALEMVFRTSIVDLMLREYVTLFSS